MKSRTILLGTVAGLALGSTVAQAGHFHGWYIGLEAGANWVDDWNHTQFTTNGAGVTVDTDPAVTHFDTGWAVLANVGYAFAGNWRVEVEAGYRSNNQASNVEFDPGPFTFDDNGDLTELTVMANVLFDIRLSSKLALSLGAGAGMDHAEFDYLVIGPDNQDDDWNFAYQGIVGLSYAIGHRTDLVLNYRYLRVVDPDFDYRPAEVQFLEGDDLVKHALTLGLRFDLTADEEPMAAPPPPPPPAPPPPSHFIVFFGFNKCNITAEADAVLSEAASAAKRMGSASVSIVGHTDTVGSPAYNQKLSVCRANAAKSNLAGKGVPEGSISTSGRGETELMVQTGDGVKEPQNRRATVDLR